MRAIIKMEHDEWQDRYPSTRSRSGTFRRHNVFLNPLKIDMFTFDNSVGISKADGSGAHGL
jgi:hypothetical protein